MENSLNLINELIYSAKKAGADAADTLFYESSSISVSRRLGKPEGLERSESRGIGLRVFKGKRAAIVSSSDTSKAALQELVERSLAMAALSPVDEYSSLAHEKLLANSGLQLDLYDSSEPTPEWLQEQCRKVEDTALQVEGITNSEGADASYGTVTFALAASNGFCNGYKSSSSSISVSVLAGNDNAIERDYDFSAARFTGDLVSAETIGKNAARRAISRLNPRKIATGILPVVFDPRVSKGLVSAFSGAINGSTIARGTSFLKDSLGKQLFNGKITIIDEPHRLRGLGSKPFDAEGSANRKTILVENGVLQTWLLDMRSANKLGLTTTGHASRSLSSPPSPSSTNLYMAAGTLTPDELISDIKNGFYVNEVFGMGVNLITGDYSQGASGFFIENGQKSYSVSEVTIAGKLQDMFRELTPANDLIFNYSTNAPTLRIEGMTVAGI